MPVKVPVKVPVKSAGKKVIYDLRFLRILLNCIEVLLIAKSDGKNAGKSASKSAGKKVPEKKLFTIYVFYEFYLIELRYYLSYVQSARAKVMCARACARAS